VARVVIADDHPLFLEAITAALETAGIAVVGTAEDGEDLLELVSDRLPDAVLLDVEMPGMSGLECLTRLRAAHPDLKVVMVSAHDDEASIAEALEAGAVCFIGKGVDPDDLALAIRTITEAAHDVHYGARLPFGSREALPQPLRPAGSSRELARLTRREQEILLLAAAGPSNAEIAHRLGVTEQTVKFHLSNIYRKLGVGNRTQAAAKARELVGNDETDVSAHSL
jgi:DNA-binding NarL/FixJ family response regulator